MTHGQDHGQRGRNPRPGRWRYPPQDQSWQDPGYGQQYDQQDQSWQEPGYGQQYDQQDQPWQGPGYGQRSRPDDQPWQQPGYGQQYDQQDQPWQQPGHGQQYRPEDQPWQPRYDPRQHQRRTGGSPEAPWQQAPYPGQDYPPQDYPPRDYPPQGYPPRDYPPRDQWQPRQPRQDYRQFQPPQRHDRRRSRAPLYAGIAAVIVLAGGGTAYALAGHGGSHGPVSSRSPATSASAVPARPASLSQLKKIVLQPADLPSGWKGTPYKPGPSDSANSSANGNALVKCVGARDTSSDGVAQAHSDDFALGNASISSSASSYRSQSDVNADVAAMHSPKASYCFEQALKKQLAASLPASATIESVSVKITPGSAGGPANVVATATGAVDLQGDGQRLQMYITVAFITGPLIEAEVDTANVGAPVPASVVHRLVATMATRAAKAGR